MTGFSYNRFQFKILFERITYCSMCPKIEEIGVCCIGGMTVRGESRSVWRERCPTASAFSASPMYSSMKSNPDLRVEVDD